MLVCGSLAWVVRSPASVRAQVEVGQRWDVPGVGRWLMKTASRVPGCGTPGDRDVISDGFTEAVQLFRGDGVGGAGAWASASASGSPAARACSMPTSVITPARGISVTRTAAGRWEINSVPSPPRPAHWLHAQVGAAAKERTGVGVLWMVTS